MDNNLQSVIEQADKDSVNLKDSCDLRLSAEAMQTMFDNTANLPYGRREFLVNSYVRELDQHADDLYGKGNHIKLEIVDSNKDEHINAGDKVHVQHVNGFNANFPLSNV